MAFWREESVGQSFDFSYQLYGHLPPITKTIQVRRTRHAGYCWRSRDEIISDVLLWTPTYGRVKAGQPARTYSSYVRIRDVALKTCQRRWMIGKSGEIGSGISVLATRDDDDDDYVSIDTQSMMLGDSQFLTYVIFKPRGFHGVGISLYTVV